MTKLITILLLTSVVATGCVFGGQTPLEEKNEPVFQEEIDTSEWKAYRNEEFGFEFKYPENWYVDFCDVDTYENWIVLSEIGIKCNVNLPDSRISLLISNNNILPDLQIDKIFNYRKEEKIINNFKYNQISGDITYKNPEGEVLENIFLRIINSYIPFNDQYIAIKFHKTYNKLSPEDLINFTNIYENLMKTFKFIK